MDVLHVAETARGGVGTYVFETVKVLQARGIRQYIILPRQHALDSSSYDPAELSTFERKRRGPKALIAMAKEIFATCHRCRPEILHAHSSLAGLMCRVLQPILPGRPRIVYSPHGWSFQGSSSVVGRKLAIWIERSLLCLTSSVIFVSEYERSLALQAGIIPRESAVVYPTIAPLPKTLSASHVNSSWPGEGLKLLFVGRLDHLKGLDVLTLAVKLLKNPVSVVVIGEAVLDRGASFEVSEEFSLLGWQSRDVIDAWMKRADMLVVPSRWESFGLVALEAMRAGTAVVASAIGGLPELVVDGETGVLVKPNDPACLAEGILKASANSGDLGKAGHSRYLTHFDNEVFASAMLRAYLRLVKAHPLPEDGSPAEALKRNGYSSH